MSQRFLALLPVPVYGRAVQRPAYFLPLGAEGCKPGFQLCPFRLQRFYLRPEPLYILRGGAPDIPEALLLKAGGPYGGRYSGILLIGAYHQSRPLLIAAVKLHQRAGFHERLNALCRNRARHHLKAGRRAHSLQRVCHIRPGKQGVELLLALIGIAAVLGYAPLQPLQLGTDLQCRLYILLKLLPRSLGLGAEACLPGVGLEQLLGALQPLDPSLGRGRGLFPFAYGNELYRAN